MSDLASLINPELFKLVLQRLSPQICHDKVSNNQEWSLAQRLLILMPQFANLTIDSLNNEQLFKSLNLNYFNRFIHSLHEQLVMPIYLENMSSVLLMWKSESLHGDPYVNSPLPKLSSERIRLAFFQGGIEFDSTLFSAADLCLWIETNSFQKNEIQNTEKWQSLIHDVLCLRLSEQDETHVQHLSLLLLYETDFRTDSLIQSDLSKIFIEHPVVTFYCHKHAPDLFRGFMKGTNLAPLLALVLLEYQGDRNLVYADLAIGKTNAIIQKPKASDSS